MTILRSGKKINKSSLLVTKKSKETPVEKEKDEIESHGFGETDESGLYFSFNFSLLVNMGALWIARD